MRKRVKQSQILELYALPLHCQLSSSSNPGTALLRGAESGAVSVLEAGALGFISPSFSTCPNDSQSFGKMSHGCVGCPLTEAETLQGWPQIVAE